MSQDIHPFANGTDPEPRWQAQLAVVARALPYPPTPLLSVLDLAGQTAFAQAKIRVPFKLRLPAYPPDLGEPDVAYVQDLGGPAAILVWLVPGDPNHVRLSLHFLTSTAIADKMFDQNGTSTPSSVETTLVNGHSALWTTGPYVLVTRSGEFK